MARLPVYLRSLYELTADGVANVSSERLAEMAGVNAAKVRKDLSYLGSYGTRGVGYDVTFLLYQMNRELGLTRAWPVVIVGAGNLGSALANYGGFDERGYPVAALVDIDRAKVGQTIGKTVIGHLDDLPALLGPSPVGTIGIIATPAGAAQEVADRLVRAGVVSILNFAPVVLSVPKGVTVRKVDLALELQILSFYQQRDAGLAGSQQLDDPVMPERPLMPEPPLMPERPAMPEPPLMPEPAVGGATVQALSSEGAASCPSW